MCQIGRSSSAVNRERFGNSVLKLFVLLSDLSSTGPENLVVEAWEGLRRGGGSPGGVGGGPGGVGGGPRRGFGGRGRETLEKLFCR